MVVVTEFVGVFFYQEVKDDLRKDYIVENEGLTYQEIEYAIMNAVCALGVIAIENEDSPDPELVELLYKALLEVEHRIETWESSPLKVIRFITSDGNITGKNTMPTVIPKIRMIELNFCIKRLSFDLLRVKNNRLCAKEMQIKYTEWLEEYGARYYKKEKEKKWEMEFNSSDQICIR